MSDPLRRARRHKRQWQALHLRTLAERLELEQPEREEPEPAPERRHPSRRLDTAVAGDSLDAQPPGENRAAGMQTLRVN